MKKIILLILVISLYGCSGEEAKKQRYLSFSDVCTKSGFTTQQCDFLFVLNEKQKSDTEQAAAIGSVALGIGVGSMGSK